MPATCQRCGMVSRTADVCEWCGVVFAPPAAPQAPADDTPPEEPLRYIEPVGIRLEFFLAAGLPFLAAAMAFARQSPREVGEIANVASAGVCFFLSLYQLVESVDRQFVAVGLALIICISFGPLAAAGVFAAVWLVSRRGECWTAPGLLMAHLAARLLVHYAACPEIRLAFERAGGVPGVQAANFTFLFAIVGWALANFWRPLNE